MINKKNLQIIGIIIILSVGYYWWSHRQQTPEKPEELEVVQETDWFLDQENGFKILPPQNWLKDEEKEANLRVRFLAQKRDEAQAGELIANLNVIVKSLEDQPDKEKFLNQEVAVLKANFPQFKLINQEKLPDEKSFLIEAEFKKGTKLVHFLQRVVFQEKKVFILTATTFADQWPDYSEAIQASLDSFELL